MMTHDPFQTYQAFGAYPGLPYTAFQPFTNPAAIAGQSPTIPGITGYGGYPQQAFQGVGLQGVGIPGQQGFGQPLQTLNPLTTSLQNPLIQNPLIQNPLVQNPLVQNALIQSALLQSQLQQNPFAQNPFVQSPFVQNPFVQNPLLQNTLLQHSLTQSPWQNPLLAASLQNQAFNPMLAYHGWPQQQPQFTYPLAPQSLIGASGIGQPYGQFQSQVHPLTHAALRQAAAYGYPATPGYF